MRAPGSGVARVWSSIATRWRAMQRGQCRGRKCGSRGAMTSLQRGHFTAGWFALRVTAEDHLQAGRARPTRRLSRERVEDERLVRRRRFAGRPTRAAPVPRLDAKAARRCSRAGGQPAASMRPGRLGSVGILHRRARSIGGSGARSVRGSAGTADSCRRGGSQVRSARRPCALS